MYCVTIRILCVQWQGKQCSVVCLRCYACCFTLDLFMQRSGPRCAHAGGVWRCPPHRPYLCANADCKYGKCCQESAAECTPHDGLNERDKAIRGCPVCHQFEDEPAGLHCYESEAAFLKNPIKWVKNFLGFRESREVVVEYPQGTQRSCSSMLSSTRRKAIPVPA